MAHPAQTQPPNTAPQGQQPLSKKTRTPTLDTISSKARTITRVLTRRQNNPEGESETRMIPQSFRIYEVDQDDIRTWFEQHFKDADGQILPFQNLRLESDIFHVEVPRKLTPDERNLIKNLRKQAEQPRLVGYEVA